MAKTVNGVKYVFPHRNWDKWTRQTIRYINDDLLVPYVDSSEVESRSGLVCYTLKIGIKRLLGSHSCQVHLYIFNSSHHEIQVVLFLLAYWVVDV